MTKHHLIVIAVGAASFGAGAFTGYKLAYKKLGEEFERRLDDETRHMKEFYTHIPQQKFSSPEEAVAELVVPEVAAQAAGALAEYNGVEQKTAYHKVVQSKVATDEVKVLDEVKLTELQLVEKSVFDQERDPTIPYLISEEEFMQGESGYPQPSLTWYEMDQKLTDDRDELLENVEATVGLDFQVNFGVNSVDENTVYVRNERLQLEFEIVRNDSSYAKDVLDQEPELPPVERISARMRREQKSD
jgi:hypothetical protein